MHGADLGGGNRVASDIRIEGGILFSCTQGTFTLSAYGRTVSFHAPVSIWAILFEIPRGNVRWR